MEGILFLIGFIIISVIFWNAGHYQGEYRTKQRVIESQEYVDTLRKLDSAEKKIKAIRESLNDAQANAEKE